MDEETSAIELNKQLSVLEENFFQELRKIAEQRLKLEQSSLSHYGTGSSFKNASKSREVKSKPFSVRLDTALGIKLAKSRGKADELEDKLQQTRMAYEDKLLTVDRMKQELDRRENILVRSIQEIDAYLRAIFYLKKEADLMHMKLQNTAEEQKVALQKLKIDYDNCRSRRETIEKAIEAFQMQKQYLENIISDLPRYSRVADLIEYYLVLLTLQGDLLEQEAECSRAEDRLLAERQEVTEFKKRVPAIIVSKESHLLDLKSRLKNIKGDIAHLDEQIDITTVSKLKDEANWYDIQRWIKKLFSDTSEIRPPGPEVPMTGTLNMLDRIKDFVADMLEIVDDLKKKK